MSFWKALFLLFLVTNKQISCRFALFSDWATLRSFQSNFHSCVSAWWLTSAASAAVKSPNLAPFGAAVRTEAEHHLHGGTPNSSRSISTTSEAPLSQAHRAPWMREEATEIVYIRKASEQNSRTWQECAGVWRSSVQSSQSLGARMTGGPLALPPLYPAHVQMFGRSGLVSAPSTLSDCPTVLSSPCRVWSFFGLLWN